MTTVISRFSPRFRAILEAGERRGIFNLFLLMGGGAVTAWLFHAFHVSQGRASPSGWHLAAGGLAVAALACLLGLHVPPAGDGFKRLLLLSKTGGLLAADRSDGSSFRENCQGNEPGWIPGQCASASERIR